MEKLKNISQVLLRIFEGVSLTLVGGVAGIVIGLLLFYTVIPYWKSFHIPSAPEKPIRVLYVDIQSTLDDPTDDILYVQSNSGKVYFSSLPQDNWQTLEPLPNGEISELRLRDGYADSPLIAKMNEGDFFEFSKGQWQSIPGIKEPWGWGPQRISCTDSWQYHPLVFNKILDSTVLIFDRPLSTIYRCYALLDNGDIRVWVRFTHFLYLFGTVGISMILGIITGVVVSIRILRFRKGKIESGPPENAS